MCACVCLTPASGPVYAGEGACNIQLSPHELLNLMPYLCLTAVKVSLTWQTYVFKAFRNNFLTCLKFLKWLTYSSYSYLVIRNKYM